MGSALCGPGPYTHLIKARCPWCCLGEDRTTHAFREVHGGYCAPDLMCGDCGQTWNADAECLRKLTEDKRDENVERVRLMLASGLSPGPAPLPSSLADEAE